MIHECGALFDQTFMGWQAVTDRQLTRAKESFLIGQNEKNVIGARSARSIATGLSRVGRGRSLAVYSIAHAKAQCRNAQTGSEQKAAPRDSRVWLLIIFHVFSSFLRFAA